MSRLCAPCSCIEKAPAAADGGPWQAKALPAPTRATRHTAIHARLLVLDFMGCVLSALLFSTHTRIARIRTSASDFAVDRVERPAFAPALDSAQVLAHEGEDEALEAEHVDDRDAAEQRPREVRLLDPVDDAVDPERGRDERAEDAQRDADPLDRLGPEPGEDVQREPRQPERRVARAAAPRRMADVDLHHRRAAGEDQRLRELLAADRAQH